MEEHPLAAEKVGALRLVPKYFWLHVTDLYRYTGQMHTCRLLTHHYSCQVGWSPVPDARSSVPWLTGEDAHMALEKQMESDPQPWRADEKPGTDWWKSLFGQADACWVILHMPTANILDSLCITCVTDLSGFTQIYKPGLFCVALQRSGLPDLPWVATHFFQLKSCITSKVHPKLHVNFKKQDDSVPELLSLFTYIKPSLQVCTWQRCVCANPHVAHHWLIIGGNAGKAFLLLDSCSLFWLVSSIVRAISLLTETSPDKVGSTWLLWQTRKEFTNRICRDACPCYLLQRASEAGAWWPFQLRQILTVVYRQLVPCDLPTNK